MNLIHEHIRIVSLLPSLIFVHWPNMKSCWDKITFDKSILKCPFVNIRLFMSVHIKIYWRLLLKHFQIKKPSSYWNRTQSYAHTAYTLEIHINYVLNIKFHFKDDFLLWFLELLPLIKVALPKTFFGNKLDEVIRIIQIKLNSNYSNYYKYVLYYIFFFQKKINLQFI